MKCSRCGSEWSVSDKIKNQIAKCPFCGADLQQKKLTTILDVLIDYGKKEGVDFFKNGTRINGLLADLFPDGGRERSAIKIAYEKGIGLRAVQLYHEDSDSLRDIQINQMKQILLEEAWLSDNASDFVLTTLISAIEAVGGKQLRSLPKEGKPQDNEKKKTVITPASSQDENGEAPEVSYENTKKTSHQRSDDDKQISIHMNAGMRYEDAGDTAAAISEYTKASILGSAEASYRIAEIYSRNDKSVGESIKWYISAAKVGHNKAQNNLGYMYEHGEGVDKDLTKALYWYSKSAISGNMNAQHNLAFFYYKGLGTALDYKKAFEWDLKSAKQGHAGAQNNLGIMYEYGYGTDKDMKEAVRWYKIAADNGNEDGLYNYNRCMKLTGVVQNP